MTSWKQLRLQILERDKYECQKYGFNFPKLDVHHMKSIQDSSGLWYLVNTPEYLVTLCRRCHKRIEWRRRA